MQTMAHTTTPVTTLKTQQATSTTQSALFSEFVCSHQGAAKNSYFYAGFASPRTGDHLISISPYSWPATRATRFIHQRAGSNQNTVNPSPITSLLPPLMIWEPRAVSGGVPVSPSGVKSALSIFFTSISLLKKHVPIWRYML